MTAEPRQDLPIPLPVLLTRPGGACSTEFALNISPGGLCLHLQEPLPVGVEVELAFTLPPAGPPVVTLARVVWSTFDAAEEEDGEEAGRLWETGVRFGELDAPVQAALRAFAEQPRDRRR